MRKEETPPRSEAGRPGASRIPVISLRGITKRFPGITANQSVDLDILPGDVHSLLGENGAGKTTLMNVLMGIYRPDAGTVAIDGQEVRIRSPRDAIAHGLGMVHQHFRLVANLTVAENVALGMQPSVTAFNARAAARLVEDLGRRYGLDVDPAAYVWQLSVGEQQRVEIVKALSRHARALILDEPTSVLTPQESQALFVTLRRMLEAGHSVIFISHKLDEVLEVSDRISVMRHGRMIGTIDTAQTNQHELARMMIGRDLPPVEFERSPDFGRPLLDVEGLSVPGDRGVLAVRNVSFSVRAGECLGFAGVAGNGQEELADALYGLRRPTAGRIRVGGADLTGAPPRRFIDAGVSYVPADRSGVGSVGALSVAQNLILKSFRDRRFGASLFLDARAVADHARALIEEYAIQAGGPEDQIRTLSGGNLQKAILGREMSFSPDVLVVVSPTRGLDVGATSFVRRTLHAHKVRGAAIVLISEDLEELFDLSDRLAVLFRGEVMGTFPARDADVRRLGLMMAGVRQERLPHDAAVDQ
ncbi:MAG TPA: ABC transporter ATP-binding protein [bacterium]|nr:ABC transporter ATP-binding protein [bacterium]